MPMEYEWHGCGAGLKARAWIERPDGKELDTYFVDGNIEKYVALFLHHLSQTDIIIC